MTRQRRNSYLLIVTVLVTTMGAYAIPLLPGGTGGNLRNPGNVEPLLVDDFESYTDEEGRRIYEIWIDGWGAGPDKPGNGTGAIIGSMWAPFARGAPIVHSGRQAMPFSYDNAPAPYYSEACRTWDTPQDWTIQGGTGLSLWIRGCPLDFLERDDGTIRLSGDGVWRDKSEGFRYAYRQLAGDGEIVARVERVEHTNDWARAGIMIRETAKPWPSPEPRFIAVAITPAHGIVFTCCNQSGRTRQQSVTPDVQAPHRLKLIRRDRTFTARHSDDGATWQDILDVNDTPVAIDIAMGQTVEIGLFAAGNRGNVPTVAEFSGVAIAGEASDSWEVARVNAAAGSNSPDSLYVALEDAAGRWAVSVHPDSGAVNVADWTQWRIPLSDFTTPGVDVTGVRRMYIGVGDRGNPQPNGSGVIHIDDIYVIPDDAWPSKAFGVNPGVRAKYFENRRAEGKPTLTRAEESIDYDWGDGEIIAGLSDNVAAVWTANLDVPASGIYTLATDSHNAAGLWLDGRLLNCDPVSYQPSDSPAEAYLVAGHLYALRMEWSHNMGDARAQLWWEGPLIPRQIVPAGPLQLPLRAAGPCPGHKAADVPQSPLLTWYTGEAATHHDVYFGDDANAVATATPASAVYRGRQKADNTAFSPGVLEWNKTCFWRVDEVNEADPNGSWKGNVWQFTTADFLVIDDFECYSDEDGNRIYETWIEAYARSWGSTVRPIPPGYDRERKIVHGGRQSMPFDYNNVPKPWYSEIERDFSPAQNWLVNGVDMLVLYVHGRAGNDPAPLYVAISDTAGKASVVSHPEPKVTRTFEWIEWRIPASQFAGVNLARVKKLSIGAGNRGDPSPGGSGRVYIDDIRMIRGGGGM